MLTCRVFSLCTRPAPSQLRQAFSITWPAPLHDGQVRSMVKKPCWARTRPRPWQDEQLTGEDPGSAPLPSQSSQRTLVGTRIWADLPWKASSREISML
jgi:hypothetical protein